MPKKGELSKTARASLANREAVNHITKHVCAACSEPIWLADLYPVKVQSIGKGKGMAYYHKEHYKVQ